MPPEIACTISNSSVETLPWVAHALNKQTKTVRAENKREIEGGVVWCGASGPAQVSPWPHLLHASLHVVVAFSTVTCYHQSQEK